MPQSRSTRKVAFGAFIGTTVEWYDFFLYGTASALIFPRLFFPSADPLTGTLLSFATFGVAFVARPFGGILFGHFGDKVGRKPMLVATLLLMGVATGLIGLMPTYATIGVAAPIILVALRILQGLSAGGEYGGAVLMAVEHSEKRRRGFYSSWVQMGAPAGLISANCAFLLVSQLPDDQLFAWAWRIPFLVSFVLIAIGLVIRLKLEESPAFKAVQQRKQVASAPIVTVVRAHYKEIALIAGAYVSAGVTIYGTAIFGLSYGTTELGFTRGEMLQLVLFSQVLTFVLLPVFAAMGDRIGHRKVFLAGIVLMALTAFPWIWLIGTGNFAAALLGYLLLFVGYSATYGTMAVLFASIFEYRLNYSGTSLGYQLGTVVGSAFAPIIAAKLLASTGTINAVGFYMVVAGVVSLISAVLLMQTDARAREDAQMEGDGRFERTVEQYDPARPTVTAN